MITIAAREDGPDLSIDVRDAGPGFPADFLPHAFERFRRPDAGRSRDGGGSGLGLAIVAAIAVAHGGTATARNQPGGGAVVSLRLPRRTRLALANSAEQVPDPVGKGAAGGQLRGDGAGGSRGQAPGFVQGGQLGLDRSEVMLWLLRGGN